MTASSFLRFCQTLHLLCSRLSCGFACTLSIWVNLEFDRADIEADDLVL